MTKFYLELMTGLCLHRHENSSSRSRTALRSAINYIISEDCDFTRRVSNLTKDIKEKIRQKVLIHFQTATSFNTTRRSRKIPTYTSSERAKKHTIHKKLLALSTTTMSLMLILVRIYQRSLIKGKTHMQIIGIFLFTFCLRKIKMKNCVFESFQRNILYIIRYSIPSFEIK